MASITPHPSATRKAFMTAPLQFAENVTNSFAFRYRESSAQTEASERSFDRAKIARPNEHVAALAR
jgi:hypothetical protein